MKRLVKRRSTRASIIMRRGGERFWPRSVAFEAREKRSDPTTRVSTLNLFSPLFFFSPVLEREWNLRGNLCLVFFLFSFFFSFDFHGTKADGCSIGQGIYDVFEHSPISRHVACAPPLYFAMTYRSPYDEDTSVTDCHVPSTLSLSLFLTILKFFAVFFLLFPLRFP